MQILTPSLPINTQPLTLSSAESIAPVTQTNNDIKISTSQQSVISQKVTPNIEITQPQATYSRPIISKDDKPIATETENKPVNLARHSESKNEEQEKNIEAQNDPTNTSNQDVSVNQTYTKAELTVINALETRDTEVTAHEQAHAAVGGQHAGSPTYSYETGPDGNKYAVEGEVSISTSAIQGDPQATLEKARQVKAAALAPSEPSSQDIKVAAKADQLANQARNDLLHSEESSLDQNADTTSTNNLESNTSSNKIDVSTEIKISSKIQQQMQIRNHHINQVYQHSSQSSETSGLNIQV